MSFRDALSTCFFKFVNGPKMMSFRGSFHPRRQEQVWASGLLVLGIVFEHSSLVMTLSKKWWSLSHKSSKVSGTFQLRAMFGRPLTILNTDFVCTFASFVTISFWNVQSVTISEADVFFFFAHIPYVWNNNSITGYFFSYTT